MNGFSRGERKEETRRRILDVARRHFERDGYEGASFRAIAEEAGVAIGTLSLHFGDKKGMLHAALYDDLEEAIAICLTRGKRGSLVTRLADIMAPAYAYYARRPELSRTLLESSLFAASPWKERFGSQVERVHVRIAAVVGAARERGEIARDTDVTLFATAVFSFYYMALIAWAQGLLPAPLVLFRAMVEQHVRGARP
ncbi:MAG: TetR/AcrR family transcriptional regulator [Labilithrix sp.]|nr:TetR/AcrR family transcriptional regulator [Labilithrix sp.]MCW5815139.1 TetR/AcrR family transcriptional regulator [Labilithrix sp.]